MLNPFMWARRRALMAANKGPTQGLVPGTYTFDDGTIVVKNYNTFVITAISSSTSNAPLIPLIAPITPIGTCYSKISRANTGVVGEYSRSKTYDSSKNLIMTSGANPTSWSGRPVYYVSFPTHYYPANVEYNLTVINDGQVVF